MAWLDIATAARRISARTAAILLRKPYGPGGAGPESGPRVGNGAVPHFGHACVAGTGHHFGLKIALFHFFFRATARTGRRHFAFMSPTALRFYLIRPGGMAHTIWTQWAARD